MSLKLNNDIDKRNDVNALIELKNNASTDEIELINRLIIILLVTKLETGIETFSSDWFNKLKSNPSNTVSVFSEEAIDEIIKETYDDLKDDFERRKISNDNKAKYKNFIIKFDRNIPLNEVEVDFRITLNRHKKSEVLHLFKKIGISNVFDEMNKIKNKKDEVQFRDVNVSVEEDLEGVYNKLIRTRNELIHNDYSIPFSEADIEKYIELVNLFDEVISNFKSNC